MGRAGCLEHHRQQWRMERDSFAQVCLLTMKMTGAARATTGVHKKLTKASVAVCLCVYVCMCVAVRKGMN